MTHHYGVLLFAPFLLMSSPSIAAYEHSYRRSWGGYDGSNCTIPELSQPMAIDIDSDGNICVLSRTHVVRIDPLTSQGEYLDLPNPPIYGAADLAIGFEDRFYVVNSEWHEVIVMQRNGDFLFNIGNSGNSEELENPRGIASSANGEVFVTDAIYNHVRVYDPDGNYLRMWSSSDWVGEQHPNKITVGLDGTIFVLTTNLHVDVFTFEGELIDTWSKESELRYPNGIDVDPNGNLYICDVVPRTIQVFDVVGELLGLVDGQDIESLFDYGSQDIAVGLNGFVYLADRGCEVLEFKRLLRSQAMLSGPISFAGNQQSCPGSKLEPIWPNPSAGRATISFALASPGHAKLAIYDVAGRLVKTIVDGELDAGSHRVEWQGIDDSGKINLPGVYFARLETRGFTQTRKILYLRER
jgi:sugar lactone lactonase YvrE